MQDLIPQPDRNRPALRQTELSQDAGPVRINKQMREMFREAFDNLGGAEWLVDFATRNDQNARVFVQAISKLIPPTAEPDAKKPVILDVPWLNSNRLSYKHTEDATIVSIKDGRAEAKSSE